MKLKIKRGTLLSLLEFQAKNDVRYYLNGIAFMAGGKVAATDGHRLALGEHDNKVKETVIVKLHKLPTKNFDHAIIDTKAGIVELYSVHDLKIGITMCELVEGRYPDVERVLPKNFEACDEVGFNVEYLNSIAKAAKYISPKFCGIKLKLQGATGSAMAEVSYAGESMKFVVMPMRL